MQIAQVNIGGKSFLIEDPIAGFEVIFKTFLALRSKYPDECKHLWLFIQKAVFGVSTKFDVKLSNVETFVQEISIIVID